MASKQAAAGEALAAQINGMSRPEMYDMMSKMKVRPPPPTQIPKPYQPFSSFLLLCLSPPTRLFTDLLTVLLMFLFYIRRLPLADHDRP